MEFVDSASMLTFNGTYLFAPDWGVEVLAALPFQNDIDLNGGGKVAATKHLPTGGERAVSLRSKRQAASVLR